MAEKEKERAEKIWGLIRKANTYKEITD